MVAITGTAKIEPGRVVYKLPVPPGRPGADDPEPTS
jgi:hypothetical protein